MFRDEYRKSIDRVHAPASLLASLKAAEAAERTNEDDSVVLFPAAKKRVLPRVLAYSGIGAAAAVLVLLIAIPIRTGWFSKQQSTAEAVHDEEAALFAAPAEAVRGEVDSVASEADGRRARPNAPMAAGLGDGEDNESDEYIPAQIEYTYADVYDAISASKTESKEAEVQTEPTAEDSARVEAMQTDASLPIPEGRTLVTTAYDGDFAYAVSEADGFVYVNVFALTDGGAAPIGEAAQSGVYVSAEPRDASVFDDDGMLRTHRILLLTTRYAPDLSGADAGDPETFCPVIADASGTRAIAASSIGIYGSGGVYDVYGAIEPGDGARMLYAFAELWPEE